jgi:DNA (cytosine-5)-methyltransferase 1
MSRKPRLLDLFCGAGGAAMGYARAGFEVVGVDIKAQPRYPFEFHQADAMIFPLEGFDAIHASPPCQAYSALRRLGKQGHVARYYLVEPTRLRLWGTDLPYVIENVVGAPLHAPIRLCGSSFGLNVQRHRLFETNFLLLAPPCQHNKESIGVYGDHPQISKGMNRARNLREAQEAMGIKWMEWRELCEAIPPDYTQWIGEHLLAKIRTHDRHRCQSSRSRCGSSMFTA